MVRFMRVGDGLGCCVREKFIEDPARVNIGLRPERATALAASGSLCLEHLETVLELK